MFISCHCCHLAAGWRTAHSASGGDSESTHLVTDRLRFLGNANLGRARDRIVGSVVNLLHNFFFYKLFRINNNKRYD